MKHKTVTPIFESNGLKMWMDGFSPIIFIRFSSMDLSTTAPGILLKKCKASLQHVTAAYDRLYSVIDISECKDVCPITLVRFCFTHFPELLQEEIKYLAFVNAPSSGSSLKSHLEITLAENHKERSGCFHDFYEALSKINTMRQGQMSLN